MKKRELIIFLILEVISGFFLGVYFGFFLQQFAKVSCEISFVFLFAGLSINLVNVLVYHKKYENLIKSLNNNWAVVILNISYPFCVNKLTGDANWCCFLRSSVVRAKYLLVIFKSECLIVLWSVKTFPPLLK